jgi:hypothetical protein
MLHVSVPQADRLVGGDTMKASAFVGFVWHQRVPRSFDLLAADSCAYLSNPGFVSGALERRWKNEVPPSNRFYLGFAI